MAKYFISLAAMTFAVISIPDYFLLTGRSFPTRWNSGQVMSTYKFRNTVGEVVKARHFSAEMCGGYKTALAMVELGLAPSAKTFGVQCRSR